MHSVLFMKFSDTFLMYVFYKGLSGCVYMQMFVRANVCIRECVCHILFSINISYLEFFYLWLVRTTEITLYYLDHIAHVGYMVPVS